MLSRRINIAGRMMEKITNVNAASTTEERLDCAFPLEN
jgi:hypothetical protein